MRVVWLVVLVACSKEPRKEAPPPQIVVPTLPSAPLKVRYAAKTENAANGSNPTFFNIVEDDGLFVVADAGQQNGPGDASRGAAQSVSTYLGQDCEPLRGKGPDAQLACAVRRVNDLLVTGKDLTTSIVAVVIADGHAYAAIAGTGWVVRIKGGMRELEVHSAREPLKPLGSSTTTALSIYELDLAVGDTLAIVNRGVVDALGPDGIARALPATFADSKALEAGLETVIAAASRGADHPAVVAIVLHAVDATAVAPAVAVEGDGKLDCQALKSVIAIVEKEPELTLLRGQELGSDDFVAKLPVLRGREAQVRFGNSYLTVLHSERADAHAAPSAAVIAMHDQLAAQVKACLPDWSVEPRSVTPTNVRLHMAGPKMTTFVTARVAAAEDLRAFQVTLRVNQLPTMP